MNDDGYKEDSAHQLRCYAAQSLTLLCFVMISHTDCVVFKRGAKSRFLQTVTTVTMPVAYKLLAPVKNRGGGGAWFPTTKASRYHSL